MNIWLIQASNWLAFVFIQLQNIQLENNSTFWHRDTFMLVIQKSPINVSKLNEFEQEENEKEILRCTHSVRMHGDRKMNEQSILLIIIYAHCVRTFEWTLSKCEHNLRK